MTIHTLSAKSSGSKINFYKINGFKWSRFLFKKIISAHNITGEIMKKAIRIFDLALAVLCAVIFAFVAAGQTVVPSEVTTFGGQNGSFASLYTLAGDGKTQSVNYQNGSTARQDVRLLGVVPVKTVSVTRSDVKKVYVSGEVFGIKLYTNGVIVVGTQSVSAGGKKVNPAEDAGIRVGDIIVSINNMDVLSSAEVTEILNDNNGGDYKIRVSRDGRYRTFTVKPVYSEREGCYKAGMWVRDSTAGIGTITFYNKEEGTFAALGHQVNDIDTNEIMPLLEGEAVKAEIKRVQKAKNGTTGSLSCEFCDEVIGQLLDNRECGLYGAFARISEDAKLYEVAPRQEVTRGRAQILSTVEAGKPQLFDVEITRVKYRGDSGQKDIVLKVTDEKLLKTTGGIVQGMSGSPLIQNGKLVGALTHVIINNPEKGYAVFDDTMLNASKNIK